MTTMREIKASEFKAKCLKVLDSVAAGEEVLVTKRGRPVARLLPPEKPADLRGSVTYLVSDEELIASTMPWEAD